MVAIVRPLVIGGLTATVPVIQAGMGVGVARARLAAAVMRAGGVGCISSVGLGRVKESIDNYAAESADKLAFEIREARRLAPHGVLAVNIMVALSTYREMVATCVRERVDVIISGAGLPLNLPRLVEGSAIRLVPVVSSGRSLDVILRSWHRKHQRLPDAVVVEGPLCGGHMAFTKEQLREPGSIPIASLLAEVRAALAPYEALYGRRVPALGAEAIATPEDAVAMMAGGFDGVQVGTRFVCSEESGIAPASKQVYVKAKAGDIELLDSPIGLPVKVLRTPLVERLLRGERIPMDCPFLCLRSCQAGKAKFCLAEALVNTMRGDTENGLFMTGSAIGRINDIIPAEEFLAPLRRLAEGNLTKGCGR